MMRCPSGSTSGTDSAGCQGVDQELYWPDDEDKEANGVSQAGPDRR
jgi:hypothetical protein